MKIIKDWHRWFAWYPVTIGTSGKCELQVWLYHVERRLVETTTREGVETSWEYREIKKS
jgi:hypothetical protein